MITPSSPSFGSLLKRFRRAAGLTQEKLAEKAGLSVTYIGQLERDNRKPPLFTAEHLAQTLSLPESDKNLLISAVPNSPARSRSNDLQKEDWGEAPYVANFYGQEQELSQLEQWITLDHCSVVAILGLGGAGKTSLAVKLAEHTKVQFDYVFWRSLQNALPFESMLQACIRFFSKQNLLETLGDVDSQMLLLMQYLKNYRCLIILDNVETVLQNSLNVGDCREGFEGYGRLIRQVAQGNHQSCLLLTSQVKPKEIIAYLGGGKSVVRSLQLKGLESIDGQKLLEDKGLFGPDKDCKSLVDSYSGNPLALQIISDVIREMFGGDIAAFLKEEKFVLGDIRGLLNRQFTPLSEIEREILYWLAIKREEVPLEDLLFEATARSISKGTLIEALDFLLRRSLVVSRDRSLFTLQPVVMEFVTDNFIERVTKEIEAETIEGVFTSHPLIEAVAREYVRKNQIRIILNPIKQWMLIRFGSAGSETKLKNLLAKLERVDPQKPSFAAGNILNLLVHLESNLRGYDFSSLAVRQAYLRAQNLHEVNFAHSDLSRTVFTDTFSIILSAAFSPDGKWLGAGTADGEVRIWEVPGNVSKGSIGGSTLLLNCPGHADWIRSIAFSPDGSMLASGGDDQTIRLWDTHTGRCLKLLQNYESGVRSIAFSPDGSILASGGEDQIIRIWDVRTGNVLHTLPAQSGWVRSVTFSPDGSILASGSDDQAIRLWDTHTGKCLVTLPGHGSWIASVAFSMDGTMLASGSDDQTVRIWDVATRQCRMIMAGHTNRIRSVTFNLDDRILASGSDDQTIRLWDTRTGMCLNVLEEHSQPIWTVTFNPEKNVLASGSDDKTIRLWDTRTGKCIETLYGHSSWLFSAVSSPDGKLIITGEEDQTVQIWDVSATKCVKTLHGHTSRVGSVACSPDGNVLASGSDDQTVRLWDTRTGNCRFTLKGHSLLVWSVTFSPDGHMLASSSEDQTIRIWDVSTGEFLRALTGHTNRVTDISFSPDGRYLASGSEDRTIRVWDVTTGEEMKIFHGHTSGVWSVAYSPDGKLLISGGMDKTVRLWEASSGRCLDNLEGHTQQVASVAFSPDGNTFASGSADKTVRLWDVDSRRCLHILQGHYGWVRSVAYFPNDSMALVSCGTDGMIKLWNTQMGNCIQTLYRNRPYERMEITSAKGLTKAERAALRTLGAIEREEQD